MKFVAVWLAFLVVFAAVFVLSGWLLMPHLPPTPDELVTAFEAGYWTTNWNGALLGLPAGLLSERATFKRDSKR